jgi:hypothetical protein
VQSFLCGPPHSSLERLKAFLDLADGVGADCGYSSTDNGEEPGVAEAWRGTGVLDEPDDHVPHAILVLSGRAVAHGDQSVDIGPGQGAMWGVGEPFRIDVVDEPLRFYSVESSILRVEHLSV